MFMKKITWNIAAIIAFASTKRMTNTWAPNHPDQFPPKKIASTAQIARSADCLCCKSFAAVCALLNFIFLRKAMFSSAHFVSLGKELVLTSTSASGLVCSLRIANFIILLGLVFFHRRSLKCFERVSKTLNSVAALLWPFYLTEQYS